MEHFTRACLVLHNYLIRESASYAGKYGDTINENGQLNDGAWRTDAGGLRGLPEARRGFNYTNEAKAIREVLTEWFESPGGRVCWQDEAANGDGHVSS